MEASDPNHRHLGVIEDCVNNAAHLTRQLLVFAREGKYEVRPTDRQEQMPAAD